MKKRGFHVVIVTLCGDPRSSHRKKKESTDFQTERARKGNKRILRPSKEAHKDKNRGDYVGPLTLHRKTPVSKEGGKSRKDKEQRRENNWKRKFGILAGLKKGTLRFLLSIPLLFASRRSKLFF
jgi:hypothetical protein